MQTHSYVADKRRILTRLRRIEGQARGLAKMIEEDRYCIDVMQQIASLRAAADGVALILLRDHLDGCLRQAMEAGCAPEKIDEVVEVVRRYSRSRPVPRDEAEDWRHGFSRRTDQRGRTGEGA